MQEIVREIFFDQVALVTTTDDEIVHAVSGINLHHVPQDGLAADLDHGLRLEVGLLGNTGPQTASKNDCLHAFFRIKPKMKNNNKNAVIAKVICVIRSARI